MPKFAKWAGLHTSHNYVGSVPEGAMQLANNAVIVSQDTVEPRRGQYSLSYAPTGIPQQVFSFGDSVLVHTSSNQIFRDTHSAFDAYDGTFTPVDNTLCRMRGVEAAQNLYVNTKYGVKVCDDASREFSDAGVPQCLEVYEIGGTISTAGYLPDGASAGYRAVLKQQDLSGIWRHGPPSQRTVVNNLPIVIPAGSLTRGVATVTAVLSGDDVNRPYLTAGETVTLGPGEANFPAGPCTITTSGTSQFTYTDGTSPGGSHTSTLDQTFTITARSSLLSIGIPTDADAGDVIELYRTRVNSTGEDPGDESFQVAEASVPAALTVTAGGTSSDGFGVVVVTSSNHGLVVGQTIDSSPGEGDTLYAGRYIITAASTNTFTYRDGNGTAGPNTVTQTYTPRTVVVEDNTPDTFILGSPAYWNPNTGDGLESSKYAPPVALDLCHFGGRLWGFNTKQPHRFEFQLVGIGSPNGLQGGDQIRFTVDSTDYTYTGVASPLSDFNTRNFDIFSGSTSLSLNIERTAHSLVRCINADDSSVPFYAVYASAEDDPPGMITIIEKGVGGSPIYVQADRPSAWSPLLPDMGTYTAVSTNSANQAGYAWSEIDEPEAFPLGNTGQVDSASDLIMRGIGLRESMFVFKRSGGVYVIPKNDPSRVSELDPTCKLIAPDTVVALNNQLYALTRQGLCTITEAGVDIIGWPVDYDFRKLIAQSLAAIPRNSFSVAYESERQLWLWLPTESDDTHATQAYIYNHATKAFTRAELDRTCGLVTPLRDIMWMGTPITLARERKSYDETDYADEQYTLTVTDYPAANTLTLSSTANAEAGDALVNGDGDQTLITDVSGSDVTTLDDYDWNGQTVTLYKHIPVEIQTVPLALNEPGSGKRVGRAVYSFREADFALGKATVATDEAGEEEYPFDPEGYGEGGYGETPYGGAPAPTNLYVTLGTNGSFITLGFKINEARAGWRLLAVTAQMTEQSERGR